MQIMAVIRQVLDAKLTGRRDVGIRRGYAIG